MTKAWVDVVLPVLNERTAIPWVLAHMPHGFRPLVVDNGSEDGSADVARSFGATVLYERRRGFGAACWTGLQAASAPIVCFMDCDGSLDPRDLSRVTDPVERGLADLVLGSRRPERGAWPIAARLANRALALELRRRVGLRLSDLGPMRAARRVDLLGLDLLDRRFGWPLEMVVKAAHRQWRIAEVPVPYSARSGRSKVTGTVTGLARTVADMARALP
ncbi:glycosyltransferase family 2 protein [soil metagenome]